MRSHHLKNNESQTQHTRTHVHLSLRNYVQYFSIDFRYGQFQFRLTEIVG